MKSTATSAVSGCIVWILLLFIIGGCLMPLTYSIARNTKETGIALKAEGAVICPKGATPKFNSYPTTYRDSHGIDFPTTSASLQCLDEKGKVLKDDPIAFFFVWVGIGLGVGLLATIALSFLLAAPAGVLIGRAIGRITKKPDQPQ